MIAAPMLLSRSAGTNVSVPFESAWPHYATLKFSFSSCHLSAMFPNNKHKKHIVYLPINYNSKLQYNFNLTIE